MDNQNKTKTEDIMHPKSPISQDTGSLHRETFTKDTIQSNSGSTFLLFSTIGGGISNPAQSRSMHWEAHSWIDPQKRKFATHKKFLLFQFPSSLDFFKVGMLATQYATTRWWTCLIWRNVPPITYQSSYCFPGQWVPHLTARWQKIIRKMFRGTVAM